MKYCIIDDEPIAHRIIEGFCENLPYLNKVGNCYDAFEGMQLLKDKRIDLVFLDIQMPQLKGFDFLKTIHKPPQVIVTTAHKEFALEGYELNITDYLLKPFSFERFLRAINKVVSQNSLTRRDSQTKNLKRLFIKGDKKTHQLHMDDVLYIQAYGNYTKIFVKEEMILSHEKISSLESILPGSLFLRVHKSFIVSINKITLIEGNRITIGGNKIPIGLTYKNQLKNLLRN